MYQLNFSGVGIWREVFVHALGLSAEKLTFSLILS